MYGTGQTSLDGQRARQRRIGPSTVCKFLNPTANNQYEAGTNSLVNQIPPSHVNFIKWRTGKDLVHETIYRQPRLFLQETMYP